MPGKRSAAPRAAIHRTIAVGNRHQRSRCPGTCKICGPLMQVNAGLVGFMHRLDLVQRLRSARLEPPRNGRNEQP